jgi:hypothetical protein
LVTFGSQLFPQFTVVVDLTVEGDDVATIGGQHRLMTGAGGVYDG